MIFLAASPSPPATPSAKPAPTPNPIGWLETLLESNALIKIALILALAVLIQAGIALMIHHTVHKLIDSKPRTRSGRRPSSAFLLLKQRREQRAKAMGQLIRSVFSVFLWVVVVLMVLPLLGLDITPLLASAGVIGIALGFGAQTLVKDYLSGIFLILEDQYGVGDVVDLGQVVGTIDEVTLRVTRLRDGSGVVWYVRNGEILRVANRSQGWTQAVVDTPVSYDQDLGAVKSAIERVADEMSKDPDWADSLLDGLKYVGVESVTGDAVIVRAIARAAPDDQVALTRAIRERIKRAFDQDHIRIPPVIRAPQAPA
ncbi:MAG: mechanosensitive ion channel family protein [Candidatus Nanopelagicales bacterium]|nr:mechanosensitive ion channel family protein [Candidatus Nanopelagicales bacterium]MDZ4250542.1 mechanosensitive ion channel family protein [Candidatus Nanopelagicales bacterium]